MNRTAARLGVVFLGLAALDGGHSMGNPTGGVVTSGAANISSSGNCVTINQCSNLAIINWQTFSIASGETTTFIQPCASSAALNRVLGGGTSMIDGSLKANGQVIIINGNGIVIGPGGSVNANSFIASTRDIADCDFLSGNLHFTGNGSGAVQNSGAITAQCGDVYLIGKTVDNEGTITAKNGTAGLAAGDDVLLTQCGTQHVFVSPSTGATSAKSQTAVNNGGTITAAQAELAAANGNLYALAINNSGTIRANSVESHGGRVFLTTDSGLVQNTGTLSARSCGNGGAIAFSGGSVWNRKLIDASGASGGSVTVNAANVQNDGTISAAGTSGCGGAIDVTYSGNALSSITGTVVVSGRSMAGTIDFLGTGATSESYLSMTMNASSACGEGGTIMVDSASVYLAGAKLNANGARGNGHVYLGVVDPLQSLPDIAAKTLYIGLGATITANATVRGNGGTIIAQGTTTSASFGTATASGLGGGTAGTVNVPATPVAPPVVTSTSGQGPSGITGGGSNTPGPVLSFTDPDPGPNNAFGQPVTGLFNLPTNTTLITSPGDSFNAPGSGAAYLFSDKTGALLSTIRGTTAGDGVGTTVQLLNGNAFVVETPNWNSGVGAITFGSDAKGFAHGGGDISSANSLIGATSGDLVGSGGLVELGNGDYLVLSPSFHTGSGAVTWVNPAVGITGVVSSSNSLVGAAPGDAVGSGGIIQLANEENYLVLSPNWGGGKGAVTNGSVDTGVTGVVGTGNSLVGASTSDGVGGSGSVIDTPFNYYLVLTSNWGGGAGAVTWNNSEAGTTGVVSSANSLVGSSASDHVGSGGITLLNDSSDFVVSSPGWNNNTGAVTLGSWTFGLNGVVGAANSLVGANVGDEVGSGGIQAIDGGGAYLVLSPNFNGQAGAVTMVNSVNGLDGVLSASNSLIGAAGGDHIGSGGISLLANSDVLVFSPDFDNGAGAVTWMPVPNNVGIPVMGVVSSANSLVGANAGDHIGSGGFRELYGNVAIFSPDFNNAAGAVTYATLPNGFPGVVSSANSLVGQNAGDEVGSGGIELLDNGTRGLVLSPNWGGGKGAITNVNITAPFNGTVTASNSLVGAAWGDAVGTLSNIIDTPFGYYLVKTPNYCGGTGAITWNSEAGGTVGVLSAANSLVGSSGTDAIGSGGITVFANGNYIVSSPNWNNAAGAITWGSSSGGVSGAIGSGNSLVGASAGDRIGSGGLLQLNNGSNYLVLSPDWNNAAGAITNLLSNASTSGVVGAANSLVGAAAGDNVGAANSVLATLWGYYLVKTPNFGGGAGAITWNDDDGGTIGAISAANSLVGSSSTDHIGSGGITILGSGHNYIVDSPDWNSATGALTWASGSAGISGTINSVNSLVGAQPGDAIGSGGLLVTSLSTILALSPHFDGDAGAITWSNVETQGRLQGVVSSSNSLVGAQAGDAIGSGGIIQYAGYYLVLSPSWSNGAGAITEGYVYSATTGVVSASNSLVGANPGDDLGGSSGYLQGDYAGYLIDTPNFNNGAGALTSYSLVNPTIGVISSANSLIGANPGDHIGSGGIVGPPNASNYVLLLSPDFNGGAGAVTYVPLAYASGMSGVVSSANSLVGSGASDHVGSGGVAFLANQDYLVLSPDFNNGAGAVTFGNDTAGVSGVLGASNSLVGANSGDRIGSGGLAYLANGNYLVLSPDFNDGAGAVTFGKMTTGVSGTVGAANSLVGVGSGDHVGSGGIIFLSNGNYLVQSPDFASSAGAVTWGSGLNGISGAVASTNSIIGSTPDAGEEYAGESADGSIYFVTFTTAGVNGGSTSGSVFGASTDGFGGVPVPELEDFFLLNGVETVEASGFGFVAGDMAYYIEDPNAQQHGTTNNVDSSSGGAVNSGHGNNIASGSSTSNASGPQRLVTPGNGVWNIFGGTVHSAPPPQWISHQLQLNLSPEIYNHLNDILFGSH